MIRSTGIRASSITDIYTCYPACPSLALPSNSLNPRLCLVPQGMSGPSDAICSGQMRGSPGLSESLIGNNLNQQHLPVLSRRERHSCLGSGPPQGPVRASVQGLQARRANVAAQQCLAPARSSGPRAGETVPHSSACQSLLL